MGEKIPNINIKIIKFAIIFFEGCSGHVTCPGAAIGIPHHKHPPTRSAHSSFDEGDQREGHLRDTYLTEISREWMVRPTK